MYIYYRIGRKQTLLISAIPLILGWILIVITKSVSTLYVSRFLSGICFGMSYSTLPMYLGEISSDAIRGSINILIVVMANIGNLLSYSIGPYVSYNNFALILLTIPIIFIVTFIWLPESPYYLVSKQMEYKAIKSLKWLRGHSYVTEEYIQIQEAINKSNENKGSFKELFSKGNFKSLTIVMGIGSCINLSGISVIKTYASQIFEEMGSEIKPSETVILMGIISLISSTVSSSIVDKFGRRPLLLISTTGVTICNFIVASYFYSQTKVDVSAFRWLPVLTIMIFIVSVSLGLSSVTYVLLSELFPTNIKAMAIGLFTVFTSTLAFAVSKLFQVINDSLGIYVSFYIFGIITFLFLVFMWYRVPETKGKSLAVILEEMNSSRKDIKKSYESII